VRFNRSYGTPKYFREYLQPKKKKIIVSTMVLSPN